MGAAVGADIGAADGEDVGWKVGWAAVGVVVGEGVVVDGGSLGASEESAATTTARYTNVMINCRDAESTSSFKMRVAPTGDTGKSLSTCESRL